MPLENDIRTDIETGFDRIQQAMVEVAITNPDLVANVDDIIGEIRGDLMLLYTVNK